MLLIMDIILKNLKINCLQFQAYGIATSHFESILFNIEQMRKEGICSICHSECSLTLTITTV